MPNKEFNMKMKTISKLEKNCIIPYLLGKYQKEKKGGE